MLKGVINVLIIYLFVSLFNVTIRSLVLCGEIITCQASDSCQVLRFVYLLPTFKFLPQKQLTAETQRFNSCKHVSMVLNVTVAVSPGCAAAW
jgi:hypothetical protein